MIDTGSVGCNALVVHFYGPNWQRVYLPYKEYFIMSGNLQKSSSLSQIVEDVTHNKTAVRVL
jgi:hypothetical protein